MCLFRWQFWAFNHDLIPFNWVDFLIGLRFDASLVGYGAFFTLPLGYIVAWIPSEQTQKWAFVSLSFLLFLPCLLTECWDLVYFQYTLKRCSFDLYLFFGSGEDQTLMQPMLVRFWFIPVLLIVWSSLYLSALFLLFKQPEKKVTVSRQAMAFSLMFVLSFVLARNSFGPKPLGILDATSFDEPARSQLVLNSPFVLLKTLHNQPLSHHEYLNRSAEEKLFNPTLRFQGKRKVDRPNLVFMVLESFGSAQLRDTVNGIPLTPFLDSLLFMNSATVYADGLSNGKTSIECLPSIFAGIPSLLEVPYILSNYSTNELFAFPKIARSKGYSTLFFHGAGEGSMRFGAIAMNLGFEKHFFKSNINGKTSEMGSWGYHDGAVFQTMLKAFKAMNGPFLGTVFTLSSHEPYDLPSFHVAKYPKLPKEASAYRYTDDCLKSFFNEAKKEPWFDNTVFIITGDHTPVHLDNSSYSIEDYYRVPIAVVNSRFQKIAPKEHLNVAPWLIESLGWKTNWYGYGNQVHGDYIRYLNGVYHVWNDQVHLEFNEHLQQWNVRKNTSIDPESLNKLKQRFYARIQRYRNDLRSNSLHP
jgi:phosphoglycerol transferase MdoB-like AlkP superfamily enzyme